MLLITSSLFLSLSLSLPFPFSPFPWAFSTLCRSNTGLDGAWCEKFAWRAQGDGNWREEQDNGEHKNEHKQVGQTTLDCLTFTSFGKTLRVICEAWLQIFTQDSLSRLPFPAHALIYCSCWDWRVTTLCPGQPATVAWHWWTWLALRESPVVRPPGCGW